MKGLKQFGAMALAAAMTITLVAPISANAAVYGGDAVFDTDNTGTSKIDEDDNVSNEITSTTYRNRITGATYTEGTDNDDAEWKSQHYYKETKKIEIGVDEYREIEFALNAGETLDKVKVKSGKDKITVKKAGTKEDYVRPSYDSKTKEIYFLKSDHTREVVGTSETYPTLEERKKWERVKYTYTYRIFGKKAGEAKLQFKINSKKKTLKVKVSEDARVFTNVTFAGKKLIYDLDAQGNNVNVWSSNTTNKAGINYITKKSGKFKATMGKNYKFVKAFVIKKTPYVNKTTSYSDAYSRTLAKRQTVTGIDLNGDGDTLDVIYGLDEKAYTSDTLQVIKNNKKVTLDKTKVKTESTSTFKGWDHPDKVTYTSNMAAETSIVVVYQNKLTKTYGTREFNLVYRVSKK